MQDDTLTIIEFLAILFAALNVAPSLILCYRDHDAPVDLRLMLLLASGFIGLVVWKLIVLYPPTAFLFLFTAIYLWRTLIPNKD